MSLDMSAAPPRSRAAAWTPIGRAHLVDVNSFVFWVCAISVVYGAVHLFDEVTSSLLIQARPAIGWVALVQWSLWAALLAWILMAHQLFVRRAPSVVLGAFLWGAFAATYFAAHANSAFEDAAAHIFPDVDPGWILAVSAATNEESLKLIGVAALFLLPRARLRSELDGLFYGVIVGLGFQIVEDFLYSTQESSDIYGVIGFLVARGMATGLFSHAVYTGITGYGLGYCIARTDRTWGVRLGVGFGSFGAAWLLHMFWDCPIWEDSLGSGAGPTILVILIKGLPLLAILLFALRAGRDVERTRWNEFVDDQIDPAILPADDVASLQTRKSRRAARHAARHAGGRHAKRATEMLQDAELRYVQSVVEEGHDSSSAEHWTGRVAALRDVLAPVDPEPATVV